MVYFVLGWIIISITMYKLELSSLDLLHVKVSVNPLVDVFKSVAHVKYL